MCRREGRPLPDGPIRNAPRLTPGLGLYLGAFYDLSTCRPVGMSEGEIPWTAIQAWADEHGIRGEQRDDLNFYVRALDRAYLRWRSERTRE